MMPFSSFFSPSFQIFTVLDFCRPTVAATLAVSPTKRDRVFVDTIQSPFRLSNFVPPDFPVFPSLLHMCARKVRHQRNLDCICVGEDALFCGASRRRIVQRMITCCLSHCGCADRTMRVRDQYTTVLDYEPTSSTSDDPIDMFRFIMKGGAPVHQSQECKLARGLRSAASPWGKQVSRLCNFWVVPRPPPFNLCVIHSDSHRHFFNSFNKNTGLCGLSWRQPCQWNLWVHQSKSWGDRQKLIHSAYTLRPFSRWSFSFSCFWYCDGFGIGFCWVGVFVISSFFPVFWFYVRPGKTYGLILAALLSMSWWFRVWSSLSQRYGPILFFPFQSSDLILGAGRDLRFDVGGSVTNAIVVLRLVFVKPEILSDSIFPFSIFWFDIRR